MIPAAAVGSFGLVLIIAGYLLRYKKRYGLIAGYDPRTTRNPDSLARLLGGVMLIAGVCNVLVALGLVVAPSFPEWRSAPAVIGSGMIVAVAIGSLLFYFRSRRSK